MYRYSSSIQIETFCSSYDNITIITKHTPNVCLLVKLSNWYTLQLPRSVTISDNEVNIRVYNGFITPISNNTSYLKIQINDY